MKRKSIMKKVFKTVRGMGKDLNRSPLGRAARGKCTKGFIQ